MFLDEIWMSPESVSVWEEGEGHSMLMEKVDLKWRQQNYENPSNFRDFDDVFLNLCMLFILKVQTQKGSNERLFILTRTHSMQILGEIPFIKQQNDT